MDTKEQLQILKNAPGCVPFDEQICHSSKNPLAADRIDILQINLGRRCNLSCRHCHVEAGPSRTEMMSRKILSECLEIARKTDLSTIDVTGGAPEMNPHLEWFLGEAGKLGKRLIVRSNLAILLETEYTGFIETYTENRVEIVTSLPDYHADRTDRQRGFGVFNRVIHVMRLLNEKGYARADSGLVLDIVHNPVGTYLPGAQKGLEVEYKKRLLEEHGIVFNNLFCITNVPVGRYLEYLLQSGNFEDYMADLCGAYNSSAAENVMCKTTISVGWDGTLYDCDFNQMLGLHVNHGAPVNIMDFDLEKLGNRKIVTGNHCYSCTAGAGSSCQGAMVIGVDAK
jgi:radical SAM/Cys-rich protein